jgi:putative oxidoreductase
MKKYIQALCATNDDVTLTIIRIVLAVIMFAHGAQKMLGWFGGHGPVWTIEMWEKWFGFPAWITVLVIIGEFFGSILLLIGFVTRFASSTIILIMLGAMYFVHFKWGFYMNWYNEEGRGEGYEYHILVLTICLVLLMKGGGKFSVDRAIGNSEENI